MSRKFVGLTVALLIILQISPASAHTVLISSNPEKGSTIKVLPSKITLTFADPLLTLGKKIVNKVSVVDPEDHVITTGQDVAKGAVLTDQFLGSSVKSGRYKVIYRVSAQDGHIVTGSFFFTVRS
jgi:methionine-rich copper-binding protein CopC